MLLTALDAGVLTLTLDRPEKRNALSSALIGELEAALRRAELDSAVRVVVLKGAGKDFCAGADLEELLASADRHPAENEQAALKLGHLFVALRQLPKPVMLTPSPLDSESWTTPTSALTAFAACVRGRPVRWATCCVRSLLPTMLASLPPAR